MSEADIFLEVKKYYLLGIEYVRDGRELNRILDYVIEEDEDEETETLVRDLDERYQAAIFLGAAMTLEDLIQEIPGRELKKAQKRVFHMDKLVRKDDDL